MQCAAVRAHSAPTIAHPQKCCELLWSEHWKGTWPSFASIPSTIRQVIVGWSTENIRNKIQTVSIDLFSYYFTHLHSVFANVFPLTLPKKEYWNDDYKWIFLKTKSIFIKKNSIHLTIFGKCGKAHKCKNSPM